MTMTTEAATGRDAQVWDLGPLSRVPPGEGRTFRVGAVLNGVFRTRRGEVYATQAHCPHRGGPLADGIIGARTVICPLHAYTFDLRTGESASGACPAIETYPVSVGETGHILLDLGAGGRTDG